MQDFKGIFPATATPFDNNNKINEKALGDLLEKNLKEGAKGFFIGGSAGEGLLLTNQEKKQLFELAAQAVKGKAKLIAHIGCISTDQAIELGKHAEKLGYDAVSSVPPYYYKMPFELIEKYFFDIMEEVEIPMVVYNFPNATGVEINSDNGVNLLRHKKVIGVKHTNINVYQLERLKQINQSVQVYNGYDEVFLAGLAMGADGAIGSTFNFTLPKFIEILDLFKSNEMEKARKVQIEANEIMETLLKVGLISGIKYALQWQGIDVGSPRRPFMPLDQQQKKMMDQVLKKYF